MPSAFDGLFTPDDDLASELRHALAAGTFKRYVPRAKRESELYLRGEATGWDRETMIQLGVNGPGGWLGREVFEESFDDGSMKSMSRDYHEALMEYRRRGGLGHAPIPPGKCVRLMRSDGSTEDICGPPRKRKSRHKGKRCAVPGGMKAAEKAKPKCGWRFRGCRFSRVKRVNGKFVVYRTSGKKWMKARSFRTLAAARRSAARWGALKGR